MEEKIKLSPPWINYFRKIEALFKEDPDIKIRYIEDPIAIRLYVADNLKAAALEKLLPSVKEFGGTRIYIEVIPSNKEMTKDSLFKTAFNGNPIFEEMVDVGDVFVNPIHYCVFRKEVVQYWNDNLADPHGNVSTLYQDIAKEVFEDTDGVIFCTGEY